MLNPQRITSNGLLFVFINTDRSYFLQLIQQKPAALVAKTSHTRDIIAKHVGVTWQSICILSRLVNSLLLKFIHTFKSYGL